MDASKSGLAAGTMLILASVAAGPALAASLSFPAGFEPSAESAAPSSPVIENWAAGSATLVPLMAADAPATSQSRVDAPASGAAQPLGKPVDGKPVDDVSFVQCAAANGHEEFTAARDALPQLKRPELKHVAEMLVQDHASTNARLSKIAEAKGWPLPAPQKFSRGLRIKVWLSLTIKE